MKLINIEISKKGTVDVNRAQQTITKALRAAVDRNSNDLVEQIRNDYFRSSFGTYKRGSELSNSIRAIPAYYEGDDVIGGIGIGEGLEYAENFVTNRRSVTIRPTKRKNLAIPLSAEADVLQRKHKNLKLLHKTLFRRGNLLFKGDPGPARTKHTRGRPPKVPNRGAVPFFVLKQSVTIHPLIHPTNIAVKYMTTFMNTISREVYAQLSR